MLLKLRLSNKLIPQDSQLQYTLKVDNVNFKFNSVFIVKPQLKPFLIKCFLVHTFLAWDVPHGGWLDEGTGKSLVMLGASVCKNSGGTDNAVLLRISWVVFNKS